MILIYYEYHSKISIFSRGIFTNDKDRVIYELITQSLELLSVGKIDVYEVIA